MAWFEILQCSVPQNQRSKLDARALKCVFIGYGTHQKRYKCYHPPTQKYFVTMNVTFYEDTCYFIPNDTRLQDNDDSKLVNSTSDTVSTTYSASKITRKLFTAGSL